MEACVSSVCPKAAFESLCSVVTGDCLFSEFVWSVLNPILFQPLEHPVCESGKL